MKFNIYISDAEQWLSNVNTDPDGDSNMYRQHLIQITTSEGMDEHGWVLVGDVEIPEINPTDDQLRNAALGNIDRAEKKQVADNEVQMQQFVNRRQKLLAISHQPEVFDIDVGVDGIEIGIEQPLDLDAEYTDADSGLQPGDDSKL